eukprot:COSAG01_NODE_349_length_18469_cov_8.136364_5_plen_169_part_00
MMQCIELYMQTGSLEILSLGQFAAEIFMLKIFRPLAHLGYYTVVALQVRHPLQPTLVPSTLRRRRADSSQMRLEPRGAAKIMPAPRQICSQFRRPAPHSPESCRLRARAPLLLSHDDCARRGRRCDLRDSLGGEATKVTKASRSDRSVQTAWLVRTADSSLEAAAVVL